MEEFLTGEVMLCKEILGNEKIISLIESYDAREIFKRITGLKEYSQEQAKAAQCLAWLKELYPGAYQKLLKNKTP
jgi:hypothetical protein